MDINNHRKVLLCIDNVAGYKLLNYLVNRNEVEVVGAIIHPRDNALCHTEITTLCRSAGIAIFGINSARENFAELIKPLTVDYIVCIYFDYILDDRFIKLAKIDAINLHPGYLPYNKGFYYYAWAVLDGTPAGVSIHRIISEVDAGPIISQMKVRIDLSDTGETIYEKHMDTSIKLFEATWPYLENKTYKVFPQRHIGTRKIIAETIGMLEIDPYKKYEAKKLINMLRVFSFPGNSGCTMELDGRKYLIDIRLKEATDTINDIKGKKSTAKVTTN